MIIDIFVIAFYLIVINIIGMRSSRAGNMQDYFLGGRDVSWGLASLSIVATETSTLTFISIPGLAYVRGIGFMHVAMGYIIGRIFVAFFLLPAYFSGNARTVYEYLQQQFGEVPRKIISVIFHITRLLADGIRLFATAIPLAMLMETESYLLPLLIIGASTFLYTYYGGIKSVIVVDTIQFFLYLACAAAGIVLVMKGSGLSFAGILQQAPPERIFCFSWGLSGNLFTSYNLISGLIGGAFLSIASHGTDHLIVQRVLSCRNVSDARKAMIWSGVTAFLQFAVFHLLGIFLIIALGGREFEQPDKIFPFYILHHVPHGLRGLMLAGIFAAAMSSLSSSINSLSASTAIDILKLDTRGFDDAKQMRFSRGLALMWTLVLIAIASLLSSTKSPLVELGLKITSITYGGVLGMFIIARFFPATRDSVVLGGMLTGIITTAAVLKFGSLFWTWFVPLGCLVTLLTSLLIYCIFKFKKSPLGRLN